MKRSTTLIRLSGVSLGAICLALAIGTHAQAQGVWETKAPMPTGREYIAVGVVNSVLFAVGGNGNPQLQTVEAYDPATNTWTTKAPMPTPRMGTAAGVLNGILYVVGGRGSSLESLQTVEAYNPLTNTWTTKAPMPTARQYPAAGVVNGVLYAVGGAVDANGGALQTVEAYDPLTNTWTTKAPMPTARWLLAVSVVNGVLYAVGGETPNVLQTVEAYDPTTDVWTTKATMPTARTALAMDVINSVLFAVGGSNGLSFNTVEAYDPLTNTWTTKASMPTGRRSLGVGVVNGVLYAVGGLNDSGGNIAANEAFQDATCPSPVANTNPLSGHVNPQLLNGWSMDYEVSLNDGLVIKDIRLVSHDPGHSIRYMARQFSIPYFDLFDENGTRVRCKLKVQGTDGQCNSQLLEFNPPSLEGSTVVLIARYLIQNIPGDQSNTACLVISQRYEFHNEVAGGCEPSGSLPCARFKPKVDYTFTNTSDPANVTNPRIRIVQRLHFDPSKSERPRGDGSEAVLHDCNNKTELGLLCFPDATFALGGNPLDREIINVAIIKGGLGVPASRPFAYSADNYHQTYRDRIKEPGVSVGNLKHFHLTHPGCPECVHIHWKWGYPTALIKDASFSDPIGTPIIPAGSNQDVNISVLLDQPDQAEDPADVSLPRDKQSLQGASPVFYYSSKGYKTEDMFFMHGGFFSSRDNNN